MDRRVTGGRFMFAVRRKTAGRAHMPEIMRRHHRWAIYHSEIEAKRIMKPLAPEPVVIAFRPR